MRFVILLSLFCACVCGLKYNGLRVGFGWSSALENIEYFMKMPRTMTEAAGMQWRRMERPPGYMPDLKLYCPKEKIVCTLYDASGFVAGVQIALPTDELDLPPGFNIDAKFVKWSPEYAEGGPVVEYWTLTQYFVSEESLKAGAGPQMNGATLQDGGVWVPGLSRKLIKIPTRERELNNTLFRKQLCVPAMGTHYFYNTSRSMECKDFLPWFALTSRGELVGTGLHIHANEPNFEKLRPWFEMNRFDTTALIPNLPPCMDDWLTNYNILSTYIYYVDDPWNTRCADGDSIKPMELMDRLRMTRDRIGQTVLNWAKRIVRAVTWI